MRVNLNNLIGPDIKLFRDRYDEALKLQGIKCQYQFPNIPDTNAQGESVVDSYSEPIDTYIFFEGNPKIKTFKRLGWAVENDSNLPFLVHCSFNLPHMQRDSVFRISGQYSELPDRVFKVTEITYDIQAPDHLICQIIPVYDDNIVGRTSVEINKTFSGSHHFLKDETDYRGSHYFTKEERGE
jgi:hypothetical protein